MDIRRLSHALIIVAAVASPSLASPASAAAPDIERITVDDAFVDTFLSQECGVEVFTRATGQVILRTFADDGTGAGPVEVATISIQLTATADGHQVRFRDVGADVLRRTPTGTLVLSISGQIPFAFTGVLKLDVETGEIIQAPRNSTADEVDDVCARLTAG
jgi:hypothetical protein